MPLLPSGVPTGAAPTLLPLTGAWPRYAGGNNANGIRDLPDGTLVLNNSTSGGLWQVDPATGVTWRCRSPEVRASSAATGWSGTATSSTTSAAAVPTRCRSCGCSASGSGWTAKWAGARTDKTLDVPSTATVAGGWLWAVNARFGIPNPGLAPYWITRLPAR